MLTAELWSDYICPWCYVGTDRTRLMAELGVAITQFPFDLHPEIPPEGYPVRPGGRLAAAFDRVEGLCDEAGMPFRRPDRVPNSRLALEVSELVRIHSPSRFQGLDEAIFRAVWVDGRDISTPEVLASIANEAAVDGPAVVDEARSGAATSALAESMERARALGIAATPTWVIGDGFVCPGPQPRPVMRRWIERMIAKQS